MRMVSRGLVALLALMCVPLLSVAQTPVDRQTAQLIWDWEQGTGGVPDAFHVKCGGSSGTYTQMTVVSVANHTVAVKAVTAGTGTYYCIVTAINPFGESLPSNEVFFFAGDIPAGPTNLRVQ